MAADPLFFVLRTISARPDRFSVYTAPSLWADPHRARQMLEFHLDPEGELASRPHAFIERATAWMIEEFRLGPGRAVLDLGCGPGLYANRLARSGAALTGVDLSENSLAHARAEAEGLPARYLRGNYLDCDLELDAPVDLALLIYADYCALSPAQRGALLARVAGWLAPEGRLLFDVFGPALYDSLDEAARYEPAPEGGFWSPAPHFLFTHRFKYAEALTYLDRYTVVEASGVRELFNWIECFDPAKLRAELAEHGWQLERLLGSVAGEAYDPEARDFAVIARQS